MKIGINLLLWTDYPQANQHRALFEKIKSWGFDGVEVPIDALDDQGVQALSNQLDKCDLQRTTISALDAQIADPSSRDPQLRATAIHELKRAVEKTREIGADLLCGPLFQGLGKFTGQSPQEDEWKYAVDSLREVGEFAQKLNIKIALEPLNRFEMYLVNTVYDGSRFVKEIALGNVGLLVDTHHGNIEENNTAKSWDEAMEHVFHVHISENNRGVPGSGQAISTDIFDVLKNNSYSEWITIEAFGQTVPDLISRLHLWRSYSEHNDDAAQVGIEFIRKHIQ